MNWLIADALAQQAPAAGQQGSALMGMLPFILLIVLLYFLMIRPQAKRAKEHKAMVAGLSKGDEVVTAGGTLGRVTDLSDNFVTLEVADGVEIKVQRHAISSLMPKGTIKST